MVNPYEVLGVQRDASDQEIKAAYRRMAMRYHPDRNAGDAEASDRFREVTRAYEVLCNPTARAKIDRLIQPVFSVGELFLENRFGREILIIHLPHAPLEPVPGFTRFACVEVGEESGDGDVYDVPVDGEDVPVTFPSDTEEFSWGFVSGLGANGKNNAEKGRLLVKVYGRKRK
jgi:curved DNA-binding protein CbpA